ncbi:MAG: hypothetical protein H6708_10330 [Kofleriaceae bacterium]|nr:hypothetical protein [Kofleriaceae bacterium]
MPRIRIVDEWIRSPATPPIRYRSVMVVAEQWAEQRVLMRAYAESPDQTRPTIVLHGVELAIGPAGVDPNGSWGIHVHPPVDGRAQEISEQLQLAAKRMAGSKGNPPRLQDEASAFERKRTDNWAPGAQRQPQPGGYYEPMVAASQVSAPAWGGDPGGSVPAHGSYGVAGQAPPPARAQAATYVPYAAVAEVVQPRAVDVVPPSGMPTPPPMAAASPSSASSSQMRRRRGWTSPMPMQRAPAPDGGARTALGWESGAGAQSAVIRLGLRPAVASQLARIGDRTVPSAFEISSHEREVLNALGERDYLSAREIGALVGVADPVGWMEQLIAKLGAYGLDIVAPGRIVGGEPTYVLAR